MSPERFETVVIEAQGGRYEVRRGDRTLLAVPRAVFEAHDADCVFPPGWRPLREAHPVRRLFWNPADAEFLMAGLETHPARTVEGWGASPYRAYLQGIWIPAPPVLLLRPFWNPATPYEPFDEGARRRSFDAQMAFVQILSGLRPPPHWTGVLNVTDLYLEALGVSPQPGAESAAEIREGAVTPPLSLDDGRARQALEELALRHVGEVFPVVREGCLAGFHTLTLAAVQSARVLLAGLGLDSQAGPYRPH